MGNWFRRLTKDRDGADRAEHAVAEENDGSLPVVLDQERMDKALAGPRHRLPPSANTPEEICSFLDHLAKDVK